MSFFPRIVIITVGLFIGYLGFWSICLLCTAIAIAVGDKDGD